MSNVDELKKAELEALTEEEVVDLETLIVEGTDARYPIKIMFPRQKEDGTMEMVKAGAFLRPLSNVEWNMATQIRRNPKSGTTNEVELLKMALYNLNGELYSPQVIASMPNGVVLELVEKLSEISGIDLEKNRKLAKDMIGFP